MRPRRRHKVADLDRGQARGVLLDVEPVLVCLPRVECACHFVSWVGPGSPTRGAVVRSHHRGISHALRVVPRARANQRQIGAVAVPLAPSTGGFVVIHLADVLVGVPVDRAVV